MFERARVMTQDEDRLTVALRRLLAGDAPHVQVFLPPPGQVVELDGDWVDGAHDRSLRRLAGRSHESSTEDEEVRPADAESTHPATGGVAPGDAGPDARALPVDDVTVRAARFQAEVASEEALLETARAAEADIARAQAVRARALAAFASRRPVSLDRPDDQVGAAARVSRATRPEALRAVSEFCVDEVAVGLSMNPHAAGNLLVQSVRLVDRMPGTLAALEAGRISWGHVLIAVELIAPLSAELRAVAEARLLPRAEGRSPQSWRPMVRRLVLELDADAITARVAAAVRERKVVVYRGADGMATLCATLPAPVARAVEDVLRRHARAAKGPGDDRSQGERMADCLVDLLLDPAGHGLTPVQAQLTVIASVQTLLGDGPDAEAPGEVSGDVIPASTVRELAAALGLLPDHTPAAVVGQNAAPPADTPESPESTESAESAESAEPADPTEPTAPPHRRAALTALLDARTLAGTALTARPTIAVTDEATGALLAHTDATGLRRAVRDGTGLGPPPRTPGYTPTAALDAFVRLRDRRCQFPGCRARPTVCDLDHQHPWLSGGRTAHDNLACLCRHHHRLSHQAPGWHLTRTTDGTGLRWQTPTGQVVVTRPTGLPGARPSRPAPQAGTAEPAHAPAVGGLTTGGATMPRALAWDADPPPF